MAARTARRTRANSGGTVQSTRGLVGYVRVSTDEQAQSGLGLDAQRAAILAAAARHDRQVLVIFEDAASGKSLGNREGLAAALAEIEAGRADGLIVAKLDRLSRSLVDFAGLMERSRRDGWALIADDLGIDTSTPQGELMATVLASFAQFERRLIGQRTRDALAVKREKGERLGRPREIPVETIERIQALRDHGLTYASVAEALNATGVRTARAGRWTAQVVHRALTTWRRTHASPEGGDGPLGEVTR